MHSLSKIQIKNFRSCKQVTLPLGDFTPLVGQNNAGKSTILDAIRLVLAPKAFIKTDVNDPARPIIISACVSGITDELIALIPDARHQSAIAPYCVNGDLWIRISAQGTSRPVAEVWESAELDEHGVPVSWRAYPTGLPQAISALLPEALHIRAMDDVQEDLGKGKAGSTIRGLLDEVMAPILTAHQEVQDALAAVRNILAADGENRSPLLAEFDANASNALSSFFPGLLLNLDVPSIDVKEFFKSGDLNVTDEVSGETRRFDTLGSGAQRAIQMALIRLLADIRKTREQDLARRLLLIDEPEIFLHPQGVRGLREALNVLSKSGFQVVFTTHSPLMVSRDNAPDTVIVRRTRENGSEVRVPMGAAVVQAMAEAQAQSRTLFELGNIAEIYFAEKVILCEGKTDQRLLPLIYEKLYGVRPELERICFVALGSCTSIPKGVSVLSAMGIKCGVIADLDFAFTHARGPWLPKECEEMEAVRSVLREVSQQGGFQLGGNGLPQNSRSGSAADCWAAFARHNDGKTLANAAHDAMKGFSTWVWPMGCIEDALNIQEKGETAIINQEENIRNWRPDIIDQEFPVFRNTLDWMREI
ncbi:ATP-dependent nuclease [Pseudomonas aeruginosa]|uniref:ATP-dependent nuclease n=1 Tax=Pseudomonas aeruginosa TaxID=287 RepID=UPI0021F1FB29|nr:AAA family ATPase [Pseudomonas aeruginosa]MCV4111273.1 AAA family ATPase [Pseudomonas aeruginosa]MCV4244145.1 AAA family ATPase [Pseudomonas aeruginosa]MCV4250092.1 AAA family ATPase [Pseudomonas aeruginosa]